MLSTYSQSFCSLVKVNYPTFYKKEKIMTVAFRREVVLIPSGTGRKSISGTVTFSSSVLSAAASLNGFRLEYDDGDENILLIEADADIASISGNNVNYRAECNLRDNSGTESYSGYVTVLVTADVA